MTLWAVPVYPAAAAVSIVDGEVPVSVGSTTTGPLLAVACITSVPVGSNVALGFVLPKDTNAAPAGAIEAAARALTDRKAATPRQSGKPGAHTVRGVVTTNVNLAAFTLAGNDGLTYKAGQHVLLVGQTTHAQNGPYVCGADPGSGIVSLTRPTNWAGASVITAPRFFDVVEGDIGAGTTWELRTPVPITVDTTPVVFSNPLLPSFTPDLPGAYGITIYNVRVRSGIPTFLGDPAGDTRYDIISSDSGTIDVGGGVDLEVITSRGDGATLRLQVNGSTVRGAAFVAPVNERSRIAAEQSTVVAKLALLVGQGVSAIGPAVATTATDLRTNYEAHRILVGGGPVHAVADNTNTVPRTEADSIDGAIRLTGSLYDAIVGHLTTGSSAAAPWHKNGAGVTHDDLKSMPLAAKPATLGACVVALADLRYRVYERHRVLTASPAVHATADSTNTLTASTKLDDVIVAYLDALALENPTAPTGEPEGIGDARHLYGFR